MSIRATIDFKKLASDIEYVNLRSTTSYVLLETSVTVNPDPKNKLFTESVGVISDAVFKTFKTVESDVSNLTDQHRFLISKNPTDSFSIPDTNVLSINLSRPETLSLSEAIGLDVDLVFSDAFTLDDMHLINKDFTGNKGNITTLSDVFDRVMQFKRDFADSTVLLEDISSDISKPRSDFYVIGDMFSNNIVIAKSDSFTLDDFASINKDFTGNKGNVTSISDVHNFAFIKKFDDSYALYEFIQSSLNKNVDDIYTISDDQAFELGLDKSETVQVVDLPVYDLSKLTSDSATLSDAHAFTLNVNLDDGFTLDDFALVNKDFTGNKGNIVNFGDVLNYGFNKEESDAVSVIETSYVLLYKSGLADAVSASDISDINYSKTVIDQAILSQEFGFAYSKLKSDLISLPEVIDLRNSLLKDDSVSTTDLTVKYQSKLELETLVASDQSNWASTLSKLDSFNFSEITNRVTSKVLTDAFVLDDATYVNKDYDGNKGNITIVSDEQTLGYRKNEVETISISDSSEHTVNKTQLETLSLTEEIGKVFDRAFTDAFTLDDNLDGVEAFYRDKANVFSISDIVSIGLGYIRTFSHSAVLNDVKTTALSKNFSDNFYVSDPGFDTSDKYNLNQYSLNSIPVNGPVVDNVYTAINPGAYETLNFTETKAFIMSSSYSDGVNINETQSLNYYKSKSNQIGLNEFKNWSSEKRFYGIVSFADMSALNLNLSLTDGFTLDDSTLINKDFIGSKGNVFSTSDQHNFTASKVLQDVANLSESVDVFSFAGRALNGTSINTNYIG